MTITATGLTSSKTSAAPGDQLLLTVVVADPDVVESYTGTDAQGEQVSETITRHAPYRLVVGPAGPGVVGVQSSDPTDSLTVDAANPLTTVGVTLGSGTGTRTFKATDPQGTVVTAVVAVAAPTPPPTPSAPVLIFGRCTYNYGLTNSLISQEVSRYSIMWMQSSNSAIARQIKQQAAAAGKTVRILMYQDPSNCNVSGDPSGLTHMLPGSQFNPAWALKDSSGNPLMWGSSTVMDVGNPAYQQACIAHAKQLLASCNASGLAFDDLFIDDFTQSVPGAGSSPAYTSALSWQNAFISFAKALNLAGMNAMANVAGGIPSYWQGVGAYLDLMEESWTNGGYPPTGTEAQQAAQQSSYFATKLANLVWAESHGRIAGVHTYGLSQAANAYALCAALLAANGHIVFNVSSGGGQTINSNEAWFSELQGVAGGALGSPLGAYTKLANGIYQRPFKNRIVVVNPTISSLVWPAPDGSSVTLGPTTGILHQ